MRRLKSQDDVGDKLFQIWDRKFDVVVCGVIVNEDKESKPIQNHPFIKQGKKNTTSLQHYHYRFAYIHSIRVFAIYTPLI